MFTLHFLTTLNSSCLAQINSDSDSMESDYSCLRKKQEVVTFLRGNQYHCWREYWSVQESITHIFSLFGRKWMFNITDTQYCSLCLWKLCKCDFNLRIFMVTSKKAATKCWLQRNPPTVDLFIDTVGYTARRRWCRVKNTAWNYIVLISLIFNPVFILCASIRSFTAPSCFCLRLLLIKCKLLILFYL